MKKILTLSGIIVSSFAFSQGTLIVNNYSPYELRGLVMADNANNAGNSCFPRAGNNITVPANANMGNGLQLEYTNYRDQFNSSLYPMATWNYAFSATNGSQAVSWNDPVFDPAGPLSTTTRWSTIKFQTFYPGTNNNVIGLIGNLSVANNPCQPLMPWYIDYPSGNYAEMFRIGDITYISLY